VELQSRVRMGERGVDRGLCSFPLPVAKQGSVLWPPLVLGLLSGLPLPAGLLDFASPES
jgi:hypothetical protein